MKFPLPRYLPQQRERHNLCAEDVPKKLVIRGGRQLDPRLSRNQVDVVKVSSPWALSRLRYVFLHLLTDCPNLLNRDKTRRLDVDRPIIKFCLALGTTEFELADLYAKAPVVHRI